MHPNIRLARWYGESEEAAVDFDWIDAFAVALHDPSRPPRYAAHHERPTRRLDVDRIVGRLRLHDLRDCNGCRPRSGREKVRAHLIVLDLQFVEDRRLAEILECREELLELLAPKFENHISHRVKT